jgi:hypothetical protein
MNFPLSLSGSIWREFHVSRQSRDRYNFDQSMFALNGNVLFADFGAARVFAGKMNAERDLVNHPESAVKASHLHAMGLLDEILHFVIARYREEANPRVLDAASQWLQQSLGNEAVDEALLRFTEQFPPVAVYQKKSSAQAYLKGQTGGVPNRHIALEELMMLWLSNSNPALNPYLELFGDGELQTTAYAQMPAQLYAFFETQPRFGPNGQNLLDLLRAPSLEHPDSFSRSLNMFCGAGRACRPLFFRRLLTGLDFIREEEKAFFWPWSQSSTRLSQWRCQCRIGRAGTLQRRPRLDATRRAARQERLRVAGSAF